VQQGSFVQLDWRSNSSSAIETKGREGEVPIADAAFLKQASEEVALAVVAAVMVVAAALQTFA